MSEDKITREEMTDMFGTHMPIEAVNLLWSADGDKTLGQIRAELREMGAKFKSRPAGMVERVAKAMWQKRREIADLNFTDLEEWGDGSIPRANHIMDEARAAIEAMQEPSDEMIDFGQKIYTETSDVRDAYVAMVHTAYSRDIPY